MMDVVDFASMDIGIYWDTKTHTWKAQHPPDFVAMRAAGTKVVWIKAQQCLYDTKIRAWRIFRDPSYELFAQAARDAGLIVGAYLFPGFGPGSPTPAEQVAAFKVATEIRPGVDLPPGFDVEFPGDGIQDTRLQPLEVAHQVEQFVIEMTAAFGVPPVVYTSHVQMFDDNGLGGLLAKSPVMAETTLWQKLPYPVGAGQPPYTGQMHPSHVAHEAWDEHDYWRIPAPWPFALLLQTQGDARGFSGIYQCDLGSWCYLKPEQATHPMWAWVARTLGWCFVLTVEAIAAAFTAWQRDEGLVADAVLGPLSFVRLAWGALAPKFVPPQPNEIRTADAADLPEARVVTKEIA